MVGLIAPSMPLYTLNAAGDCSIGAGHQGSPLEKGRILLLAFPPSTSILFPTLKKLQGRRTRSDATKLTISSRVRFSTTQERYARENYCMPTVLSSCGSQRQLSRENFRERCSTFEKLRQGGENRTILVWSNVLGGLSMARAHQLP